MNLELLETHFAVKKKKEKKKKKQEKKASKSTGPVIKKANIVDAERYLCMIFFLYVYAVHVKAKP